MRNREDQWQEYKRNWICDCEEMYRWFPDDPYCPDCLRLSPKRQKEMALWNKQEAKERLKKQGE